MSESGFLNVTVELPAGGLFAGFGQVFKKEMVRVSKEISNRLQRAVKEEHRYNHITRNLRDATLSKGNVLEPKGLTLELDTGKAKYGIYIIKGFKSWASDPFFDDALKNNKAWIEAKLQEATDQAIIKYNKKSL